MSMISNAHEVSFHGAIVNNVGGNQINQTTNIYLSEEKALALLKPANQGGYDVPRCMDKTRESVFKEIALWMDALDSASIPNILWIRGSPGAGKSAVASSLVSTLMKGRRLGSFFFCKRGDANLGDPTAIWRTIAHDLAQFHPSLKSGLVEFLSRPGFRDTDITLHFECMIEDLLMKNQEILSTTPPVIIIDALDECGSDDTRFSQRRALLDTINRWPSLPRLFKLIVTSRDERVPKVFYDDELCRKITLETGDSVSDETGNDIRTFFKECLDDIRPRLHYPPSWPSEQSIDQMTRRAAGLFIWAKTAMAFMEEKRGNPKTKLKLILSGDLGKQEENINLLYRNILDFAFHDTDDETLELFRIVVGFITVARTPLHISDLKHFVHRLRPDEDEEEDDWQINTILHGLSSVLELDGPLRLKHLSFADFLSDPKRCLDRRFTIDQCSQHQSLTIACLRTMNTELRFNICELESSHVRIEDVADLQQRISKFIPTRLSYSSLFWAAHLCDASVDEKCRNLLLTELTEFFSTRLLYWLEVMSLIKAIPTSLIELLRAKQRIEALSVELSDIARDASRFVANFHTPISESPPHIYISALPFSPRKSLISKQFLPYFPETLSIVNDVYHHWPALVNVLTGHTDGVKSVAFSPDGKQAASGSKDKTVRVWDIETGEIVAGPFTAHTDSVLSVTFSRDGKWIASGSHDRSIYVWDLETCKTVAGPFSHNDSVNSVAFSPDGKLIASGSSDFTVCVWDVEMGKRVTDPLEGHTDRINSVVFSPDGKQVVSGSTDRSVRMWDVRTGQALAESPQTHSNSVRSVAYSQDGMQVISCSTYQVIHMWDISTGKVEVCAFAGRTSHTSSFALSSDRKLVAMGSYTSLVSVGDVTTGHLVAGPFSGHTDRVYSVAFSPDGKRVISSSIDKTVCVWDTEAGLVTKNPPKEQSRMISIDFSPDGNQIVSGSSSGMICVWDILTGDRIAGPFEGGLGDPFVCVAFSPDGERIAYALNKTIHVRDVKDGRIVAGPLNGHDKRIKSIAFSLDGKRIISGSSDKAICIWVIDTGESVEVPFVDDSSKITSVAFSLDGKHAAAGSFYKTPHVWDIETGLTTLEPQNVDEMTVSRIAFSPYGKHIATGSNEGYIAMWDISTGKPSSGPFKTHSGHVISIAISPDGGTIVSGSTDTTVRIMDVKTGEIACEIFRGRRSANTVAFSRDGTRIASTSSSDTAVWYIKAEDAPNVEKRHLDALLSIGGPTIFSPHRDFRINGWLSTSTGGPKDGEAALLFWVPSHYRRGLCDAITYFPLHVRRTQLDLSRFVHGTSWTRCRGRFL